MIDKFLGSKRVKQVVAWVLIVSLLLTAFAIVYPAAQRAERIDALGGRTVATASALSTSIEYLASEELRGLVETPGINESFKELGGLMARVREDNQFARLYILSKGLGGKYFYVLDSGYRDNGVAGVDYQSPGAEFKGQVQTKTKKLLEKVYTKQEPASFTRDIVTTPDGRSVLVAFSPLMDHVGQVNAVLVAEAAADRVNISTLGPINFGFLTVVSGSVFLITLLIALALRSWRKVRAAKKAEKEAAKLAAEEAKAAAEQQQLQLKTEVPETPAPAEPAPVTEPEPVQEEAPAVVPPEEKKSEEGPGI